MAESRAIFVDTSAHYAALNNKDSNYSQADTFLKAAIREGYFLFTTNFVIAETYTLIRRKLGHYMAVGYIEDLPLFCNIIRVETQDEERAW